MAPASKGALLNIHYYYYYHLNNFMLRKSIFKMDIEIQSPNVDITLKTYKCRHITYKTLFGNPLDVLGSL